MVNNKCRLPLRKADAFEGSGIVFPLEGSWSGLPESRWGSVLKRKKRRRKKALHLARGEKQLLQSASLHCIFIPVRADRLSTEEKKTSLPPRGAQKAQATMTQCSPLEVSV